MAPAGPGRSRWPSSMAVTEDRGRWSPAPPEAFPLAAPVGPGRRPRSEGVPAWSAQGQTVATREPRFRTLREPRRAPGPCQLQGCGCSPAKGETVNDDNHHELAPRRRAHLRSRQPSPRHGAAERTKHSRLPPPPPAGANPQPAQAPHRTGHGGARPPAGAPPHTTHAEPQWRTGVHRENSTRNFQKEAEEKLGGGGGEPGRPRPGRARPHGVKRVFPSGKTAWRGRGRDRCPHAGAVRSRGLRLSPARSARRLPDGPGLAERPRRAGPQLMALVEGGQRPSGGCDLGGAWGRAWPP